MLESRVQDHERSEALVRRIARRFGAGCALLRFTSDGRVVGVAYHHDDEVLRAIVAEFVATPERVADSEGISRAAAGEALLLGSEGIEALESALSPQLRSIARRAGLSSAIVVPIRDSGGVWGALALTRWGGVPPFSRADLAALEGEAATPETGALVRDLAEDGEPLTRPQERFGAAFVHAPVGFALFHAHRRDERRLMDVNPALCELLRAEPDELLAHPAPHELIHPDDAGRLSACWDRVRSSRERDAGLELRIRRFDGGEFDAALQLSLIRDLGGEPLYGLAQLQDVGERRKLEGQLRARSEHQRLVAALSRRALQDPDLDRVIDEAVRTVAEMLDADSVRMLEAIDADEGAVTRPAVVDDVRELEAPPVWMAPGMRSGVAVRVADAAGEVAGCLAAVSRRPRSHRADEVEFLEAVAGVIGVAIDRHRAMGAARRRGVQDGLGGLPPQTVFMDRVGHALTRATRAGSSVAVLVLDLDRFQQVNDAVGYSCGDDVLREVTSRMTQVLRNQDTLARLGSDEFAILCEDVTGEAGALQVADRVLEALSAPIAVDEHQVVVTASVGVAVAIAEATTRSPEVLVGSADTAKYRAKAVGGGRAVIFEPGMRRRAGERARLETDLRQALENDEFELHYQPIVHLRDPRIVAVEALVRWHHPERGMVSPAAFVPIAEETGLIVPLGEWVLREACRQLATWEADPAIDLPYMSVNLSGRQLAEPSLVADVAAILKRAGVAPERIALELTESVLMEETSSPTATLQQLKALGVRLMLDDFGTGYSSLNYVKRFPVEALKVDRSFLADVTDDEASRKLLRAIVTMATALGVDVVAEGVEDDDQLRWMRRLGFTLAQGYGLCRPAPAAALESVLRGGLDIGWLRDVPGVEDDPVVASDDASAAEEPASITLGEAAEALGVSASTLRRWADAGRIRALRTSGGHRRFPIAEVRRLAAASSTLRRPVVRSAQLPVAPMPRIRDLLRDRGQEITGAAARLLYEPTRGGWFAADTATEPIGRWSAAIVAGCDTGEYAEVVAATRRLAATAGYAGASLVERHDFVDRFGDIALRRLQELQAPRDELIGLRRLLLRMRQAVLDEASTTG